MKKSRKYIGLILVLALLMSVAAVSVFSTTAATISYIRGDADSDGTITISDVTFIQRELAHLPVSGFNGKAADVDGNGLSISDATWIQRYLARIDNPYGVGDTVTEESTEKDYELPFVPN